MATADIENQDKPFVVCYKVKIYDEEPKVWPVEPRVELGESPIEEDEDGGQFIFFTLHWRLLNIRPIVKHATFFNYLPKLLFLNYF